MVEAGGDDVAHPRGAVVAEEVVLIVAVFRPVVGLQQDEEVVDLLGREAEALFPDGAPLEGILAKEVAEACAAQAVVEVAAAELPVEVGGVEVEGAVVVGPVDAA